MSYEYWTLVETVRTERGPRQRIVGHLGKLPGLAAEARVGWEQVGRILSGRERDRRPELFAPEPEPPDWATVDLGRMRAERPRRFGDVYLALAMWKRLGLDALLREAMPESGAEIGWDALACLLVTARFCEPSIELAIAEHFYGTTALDDLLGIPAGKANDDRLYRALDALLPHKDAICRSAQRREKEQAILRKQAERLEEKLLAIQASVRAERLRNRGAAERRIGRWLGLPLPNRPRHVEVQEM